MKKIIKFIRHPKFLICFFSLFFCFASLWNIHEDDIFINLKTGDELLNGHPVQMVDEWSYTISGKPWINFSWLSTVLIRAAWGIGESTGLVLFRLMLLFSWFFLFGKLIQRYSPNSPAYTIFCLFPLTFVALHYRLHLRPELFIFIAYTMLIYFETLKENFNNKLSYLFWPLIVLICSNLHGGSTLVVLLTAMNFIFFRSEISIKEKLILISSCIIAYFCTPIHFNIINSLIAHEGYDTEKFYNSEWIPFQWRLLNYKVNGQTFITIFMFFILGLIGLVVSYIEKIKLPIPLKKYFLPLLLTLYLGINYIRAIPFALCFFIPFSAITFNHLKNIRLKIAFGLIGVLGLYWVGIKTNEYKHLIGLGVNKLVHPVNETDILKNFPPKKHIFTDLKCASYLLWHLEGFESFIDHRDIPFKDLKEVYSQAFSRPDILQKLVNEYEINVLLLPYTTGVIRPDGDVTNPMLYFAHPKKWALMGFSHRYALYYKRIPEHDEHIKNHSITELNPSFPPSIYFKFNKNSLEQNKFENELKNCLLKDIYNTYCHYVQTYKLIHAKRFNEAEKQLEIIASYSPKTVKTNEFKMLNWLVSQKIK